MDTFTNIGTLILWIVGTYVFWFMLNKFTNLSELQGDQNGDNLNKEA